MAQAGGGTPGNGISGGGMPGSGELDSGTPDSGVSASDDLSLEMVIAALRADSSDIAIYARVLTDSLGQSLPAGSVSVERSRSLSDRMQNRPGTVTKISVHLGEKTMTLGTQRGAPVAEICHQVRGIVLSRTAVPIDEWAAELARGLMQHAEQNAQAATALRRLVAGE